METNIQMVAFSILWQSSNILPWLTENKQAFLSIVQGALAQVQR